MECPNCESEFEGELRVPRILPHCGHSLCQPCLKALWRQRQILCPQCGKSSAADSQDAFPINHSLIQVRMKGNSDISMCAKHGKTLEAFCMVEREVLCVVCILGDLHKTHEVYSLSQAASSEREHLASLSVKLLHFESEISLAASRVHQAKSFLSDELSQTKSSLTQLFDLVREVVKERETAVIGRLQEGFDSEMRSFEVRLEEMRRKEFLLQALKAEISKTEDETDYEILIKSRDRDVVANEALIPLKSIGQAKTLAENSREGELNTIWRQVRERFLQSGSQVSVKKPVPVTLTSLDQARDARKQHRPLNSGMITSAEEFTFKKAKKQDTVRRLSPSSSMASGLRSSGLKVTVHPARKTSPAPKTPQAKIIPEFKKKKAQIQGRISSPLTTSDLSSDLDDTPVHTHTVDLYAFLRQPTTLLYTLGGFSDGITYIGRYDCTADVWDPAPTVCGRTLFGCVLWGEAAILLLGGKVNGKRVNSSELFDPSTNDLRPGPLSLRSVRSGFACLRSEQTIYCLGGSDGTPLKIAEMWDGKGWTALPDMMYKRDELAGVIGSDGNIYVFGGYGGTDMTCQHTCERFSMSSRTWTTFASMKIPRRALSAVALTDTILAIGGYDGSKYLNSTEQFSLLSQQWATLPSMSQPRCAFSAVVSPDFSYVYAVGGFNGSALRQVERLNVRDREWKEVTSMPQPRFMHAAVIFPHTFSIS